MLTENAGNTEAPASVKHTPDNTTKIRGEKGQGLLLTGRDIAEIDGACQGLSRKRRAFLGFGTGPTKSVFGVDQDLGIGSCEHLILTFQEVTVARCQALRDIEGQS